MNKVKPLYERFLALPWPALGGRIGHFVLYDSLMAGCADRAARGLPVDVSKIPAPDDETVAQVAVLRGKTDRSEDERAFLEYYGLLEEIRVALIGP
jgi:hypothetical protein